MPDLLFSGGFQNLSFDHVLGLVLDFAGYFKKHFVWVGGFGDVVDQGDCAFASFDFLGEVARPTQQPRTQRGPRATHESQGEEREKERRKDEG